MTFRKECPICGRITPMYIKDVEYAAYRYNISSPNISLDDFKRIYLETGMCYDCQEEKLNTPVPFNKAAWGEPIGYCRICQCKLYSELDKVGEGYRCPKCKSTYVKINDVLCHTTSWR